MTERLSCAPRDLERAARALRAGRLVAFPTETVYGLGGDGDRRSRRGRDLRGQGPAAPQSADRPRRGPRRGRRGSRSGTSGPSGSRPRFWPGALTLILPRAPGCPLSPLVSAGGATVGLRAPAHPVARALLQATALPVAAPSANPAGGVSPTTADHVARGLGDRIDLILDGGRCRIGIESTVLDLTEAVPRLLRPGGVARAALEAEIGPLATGQGDPGQALPSPGQLASHYAPARPLRLDADTVAGDEALLAFGPEPLEGAAVTLNLSVKGDLAEAAANLFSMLHRLDQPGFRAIAVMPIPGTGLGEAIQDRLARAAAPRPPRPSGGGPIDDP